MLRGNYHYQKCVITSDACVVPSRKYSTVVSIGTSVKSVNLSAYVTERRLSDFLSIFYIPEQQTVAFWKQTRLIRWTQWTESNQLHFDSSGAFANLGDVWVFCGVLKRHCMKVKIAYLLGATRFMPTRQFNKSLSHLFINLSIMYSNPVFSVNKGLDTSKGYWRWCITFLYLVYLDIIHRPIIQ
jgi:hypothetical protein